MLDGVDGKLARTKVETTAIGDWEHVVDYGVEPSWWTALAWHFYSTGLTYAYGWLLVLFGSDLIDRLAKRVVKKRVGRNLDDVSNFDRFVRYIGARRNINIWILIAALLLGVPAIGFVFLCWWTAAGAQRMWCALFKSISEQWPKNAKCQSDSGEQARLSRRPAPCEDQWVSMGAVGRLESSV